MADPASIDREEIARFDALAARWWDPDGEMKPLHRINPVRLGYLRARLAAHFGRVAGDDAPLAGLEFLDVGCGGGLIAEPLARLGAAVTGIDAAETAVAVASAHAAESGLAIDYRVATAEDFAAEGRTFDAVLALEIVEHVADAGAFLATCAALVRPAGALALSTLNRTPKSYAMAIVAAERLLGWLPRGTHDYARFLRPSELAALLRPHGFAFTDLAGLSYHPLGDAWRLCRDLSVNYIGIAAPPQPP